MRDGKGYKGTLDLRKMVQLLKGTAVEAGAGTSEKRNLQQRNKP